MSTEVPNEVIKILAEKRILSVDGISISFSEEFFDMIFRCIHNIERGKKILKIKTFDDIVFQSTNNAVLFWNYDLGLKLSDAEYDEECITCWSLIRTKYLDSIKNKVKQDRKLCSMLEKDGIKINWEF